MDDMYYEREIDLQELFEKHKKQLFFSAFVMLENKQDAEDALQEVFLLAYKFIKKNKIEFSKAWLAKILLNYCRQVSKKTKKVKTIELNNIVGTESDIYQSNFEALTTEEIRIWGALNKLDPHEKSLIMLRYVQDLKISDIAEIMSIKEGTVKSQISRALSKVRLILNKEEDNNEQPC